MPLLYLSLLSCLPLTALRLYCIPKATTSGAGACTTLAASKSKRDWGKGRRVDGKEDDGYKDVKTTHRRVWDVYDWDLKSRMIRRE